MKESTNLAKRVRDSRFPASLFFVYLIVLLLMSGIHTGLIVGVNELGLGELIQTVVPIIYWTAVAVGLTLFTRIKVRSTYEEPLHKLADATKRVSEGDFSVYIAPFHTSDRMDYLDIMIVDFNKMVGELGSIETLKTDFFSNVSHEIKTPIASIQNTAELLAKEGDLTEEQRRYTDTIIQSSRRLSDLIGNILKLNKLEKQTIVPEMEVYDVCDQLVRCAIAFEPEWDRKNLEFDAELEDFAMIRADAALMELVWNNLLSNAVKFTEPGGSITLSQRTEGDMIYVSVQDSGCGMTEETKKHIFEKFYQGDTSHSMAGNGLGLALALRVLQLNNFEITVDSTPRAGSLFTVMIPVAGEEAVSEYE